MQNGICTILQGCISSNFAFFRRNFVQKLQVSYKVKMRRKLRSKICDFPQKYKVWNVPQSKWTIFSQMRTDQRATELHHSKYTVKTSSNWLSSSGFDLFLSMVISVTVNLNHAGLRALSGTVPRYLSHMLHPVIAVPSRRHLQLLSSSYLDVHLACHGFVSVGDQLFITASPRVCNSLQNDVTSASSLPVFCWNFKAHWFLTVVSGH